MAGICWRSLFLGVRVGGVASTGRGLEVRRQIGIAADRFVVRGEQHRNAVHHQEVRAARTPTLIPEEAEQQHWVAPVAAGHSRKGGPTYLNCRCVLHLNWNAFTKTTSNRANSTLEAVMEISFHVVRVSGAFGQEVSAV